MVATKTTKEIKGMMHTSDDSKLWVSLDELNKEFDKRIVHNIQEADDFGIGYNCALSELKRFFGTELTSSDYSIKLNAPDESRLRRVEKEGGAKEFRAKRNHKAAKALGMPVSSLALPNCYNNKCINWCEKGCNLFHTPTKKLCKDIKKVK